METVESPFLETQPFFEAQDIRRGTNHVFTSTGGDGYT
jgi:hypothetical protein